MDCNSNDCSNITLPASGDLRIQYSTNGTTWTTTATGALYIRFSVDGGTSWGGTITLPVGPSAGKVLKFDGTLASTTVSASEQMMGTQYTMPANTMGTNGDYLIIEAFFDISAAVVTETIFYINVGATSPAANHIASFTYTPTGATSLKLTSVYKRVGAASQYVESRYELYGLATTQGSAQITAPLDSRSDTLSAILYIQASVNTQTVGVTGVDFRHLTITLYEA